MPLSFDLNESEKIFLSKQARLSIGSKLSGKNEEPMLPSEGNNPTGTEKSVLYRNLGSFVTLSINHSLRGCIGTIVAHEPLYINVWRMARAAAFQDSRFSPLTQDEWSRVSIEISVLDQPTICPNPDEIVIGRDGLILQLGFRSGVFLPQVPVEQQWNLDQYLNHLCIKAGLPFGSWKNPEAKLFWYQALVFPG